MRESGQGSDAGSLRGVRCGRLATALFAAGWCALATAPNAASGETVTVLDRGWQFCRDGKSWRDVRLPHDWAISGPFAWTNDLQVTVIPQDGQIDPMKVSGRTGALPWTGEGFYRTTVTVPEDVGFAALLFEGAMSETTVTVDGRVAGGRPYGYIPFTVPLPTKAGAHAVEVKMNNIRLSTRWYPGAGLYRPVRLVTGPALGLAENGTFVYTTSLAKDGTARLAVSEEVRGDTDRARKAKDLQARWRLLGPDGRVLPAETDQAWVANGVATAVLTVKKPVLWEPRDPQLCTLVSELVLNGKVIDSRTTRFGIRTVRPTPEGFLVNGKPVIFNGCCQHQDLGSIGAEFNASAFRRQLAILREMGCNAIRPSHNPPAPDAMSICDEEGFLVMAEAFDAWKSAKVSRDYSRNFKAWWERDLSDLVLRYRNHPSIVLWSVGNEIWEKDPRDTKTIGLAMVDVVHRLDPSRPVTQGVDRPSEGGYYGYQQHMDIPCCNYNIGCYDMTRRYSKYGLVLGSETASCISSRGHYIFPVKEEIGGKDDKGVWHDCIMHADGQSTSYDVERCFWGRLADEFLARQEDCRPWLVGEFVWTGFDYLGEPTPYKQYWPSRSSYFGIVDLAGIPKDRYWLYRSVWNPQAETLHVLPHWTWPGREGQVTPVYVYTSHPSAELFVNGRSQGRRAKVKSSRLDRYRLRWNDVVYEPGELKVVAYDAAGKAAAETVVKTAGAPARVTVTPETPSAPERDAAYPYAALRYYRVRIVDRDGTLCPDATNRIDFAVTGGGRFKGLCNGDPTSLEVFTEPTMRAFHGELVLTAEVTDATKAIEVKGTLTQGH